MRVFSILLALSGFLFFAHTNQAHAFGAKPFFFVPPLAQIQIVSVQGNNLHLRYFHLPDLLRGQRNPTYTVQLVGQHGNGFYANVARVGCGSGMVVVKLPPNMPPDHYKVVVRNAFGDIPAQSRDAFYYVPKLGHDDNARVVFDTFGGHGPYDKMTYYEFKSSTILEAIDAASFRQLVPAVWYCNGECWVDGAIYDRNGNLLSRFSQQTWAAADGFGPPVTLQKRLFLKRGERVRVNLKVRTTMSVGIHTSGAQGKWKRSGNFSHFHSGSTHEERGGIRFQMIDMR